MKKVLILLLVILIACSSNTEVESLNNPELNTVDSTTSTTSIPTTTTNPEQKIKTLNEYLGSPFSPAYSPNELLYFEKNMNDKYFSETRNKLIEENLINLSITETTEYRNTIVLFNDVPCEEDSWIVENASREKISPEEYCNRVTTVSDWNYIRYPVFKDVVPSAFQDSNFDEIPIGFCLDSLNKSIYEFAYSYSEAFYSDVLNSKVSGYNDWHNNILSGDFQITWISPRDLKEDGTVSYGQATFIGGDYSKNIPSFFLEVIDAEPDEYGFISIVFDFYIYYAGAANGKWLNETFNYDLVNCKRIYLDDIFSSKNLSRELSDGEVTIPQSYPEKLIDLWSNKEIEAWVYALNYEYSKVQCLLDNDYCENLGDLSFNYSPSKELFNDFAFDSQGIILYFDKYQISCGACNVPFPLIQYERIFRILDFNKLNAED